MKKIENVVAMYDAVYRTAHLRGIDLGGTDLQPLMEEWYSMVVQYLKKKGRYEQIGEYLRVYLQDLTVPVNYKIDFVLNKKGGKLCIKFKKS